MDVTPGTRVQHRNGQVGVIQGPHGGDHNGDEPVFTCKDPNCYDVLLDGSTVHVPWHKDDLVPLTAALTRAEPEQVADDLLTLLRTTPCPQLVCTHILKMIRTSEARVKLASDRVIPGEPPTVAEMLMAISDLQHAADELKVELIEKLLGVPAT